ncbi:MAG: PKD domain-containing protein [Pirellulales bacterium]
MSTNSAVRNENITFDASTSSHGRPDRQIVSYLWDFGDGAIATGPTATHAYNTFGSYTVTLTVAASGPPSTSTAVQGAPTG